MPKKNNCCADNQYSSHIMDSVADGVFTVDLDMKIVTYNRAAETITGVPHKDAIGRHCHEIFRTAVCFSRCPVREALETGQPVVGREVKIQNSRNETIPISVSASVLYDENGTVIGAVETIRNLGQLYAIIDSVSDGLFTVDADRRITNFNKSCEEITGVSHDEALGKFCYDIFHTEVCNEACPLIEAIQSGQPIQREVDIIDRAGQKRLISVSASTLFDESGQAVGGIETIRDLTPITTMREELREKYTFRSLISRNPGMRRLFDVMEDIAASEATVLLHGESGTGKELFARAIHELSHRRTGPMVTVNCGALPETLLESEIFGVRKGAFTGATENRPGRLELCQGGTFFLDEVGDLPLPLQVKLLRVLENREFQPLGGRSAIKADVRFVTATHRNLQEMVANGTFRQDLYFRINVVTLNIPPLRERREDIPMLVEMALKRFNLAYNKRVRTVAPDALHLLLNHAFPGNVRELLNLLEQSVILCKGTEVLIDHLPQSFIDEASKTLSSASPKQTARIPSAQDIAAALATHGGNRAAAAQELGIERTTLWRWMKRHDIKQG